jgi:hypothetical protein
MHASSLIIMHGCIDKAAARQAPMFMILDESAAGRRKQRQLKK